MSGESVAVPEFPEKELIGHFGAASYNDAAQCNLASPHPVCIGQIDHCIVSFFRNVGKIDKVSTLKMLALGWSSLRAAAVVTRMGMTVQAPPIQRQALEAVVYGCLFSEFPEFHQLWKERHENPKSAARFKREAWTSGLQAIRSEKPNMADGITQIYQGLIDWGAHPNPLAIEQTSNYSMQEGEDLARATFSQLQGQPFVDQAHLQTASVYLILSDAIEMVWPTRFTEIVSAQNLLKARQSTLEFCKALRTV